ncbi:uncharacterized protein LOC127727061 [Mytilus californianus]|uniref:uncharacterized protein LOC127727061 n=1 Tax=Mytilus californianus TaxID=6549 RepID=UPI002247712F|nr:uncharacterized protein LOC127727061 [Mytilus californianus]
MTTITHSSTHSSQRIFVNHSITSTTSVPPVNVTGLINDLHVYLSCVNKCPSGYYMNQTNKSCLACEEVCQNCNNFNESLLTICTCNISEGTCFASISVSYNSIIVSATALFIFLLLIILRLCLDKCEKQLKIENIYQGNLAEKDVYVFDNLHRSKKHICLIGDQNVRNEDVLVDIHSGAYSNDNVEASTPWVEDGDEQCLQLKYRNNKYNDDTTVFAKAILTKERSQQRSNKENKHLQAAELSFSIDDESHRQSSSPEPAYLENTSFSNNSGSDKPDLCKNKENNCSFDNNIPGLNHDNRQSSFHNLPKSILSEFDFGRVYKRISTDSKPVRVTEMSQKSCINDNEHVQSDFRLFSNDKDCSLKSSGTDSEAISQSEYDSGRNISGDLATVDLICDGTHLHCFVDKRLINNYKDYLQRTVNDDKVAINELFYKLDEITIEWKMKSEYLIIISLMNAHHESLLFKEILLTAVENKLSFVCRWLLSHFQYEDECIVQVLSKSFEVGNNGTIKTLAWKVTRQFYKKYKKLLDDNAIDIYPAYKCECHNACTKKVCLLTGKKIIAIEWKGNERSCMPAAFFYFDIKLFSCDNVCKTGNAATDEMKDIMSKISDNNGSSSSSLLMNQIDGQIASTMFEQHRNLSLICPSFMKSTNYGFDHKVSQTFCIQLFCKRKGYIPLGENHFPSIIKGQLTDVLQGHSYLASTPLRIGDKIGTDTMCGTLGGFYRIAGKFKCFLTCAHVLYSLPTLLAPKDDPSYDEEIKVFLDRQKSKSHCGDVFRGVFNHDDPNKTSVDAGLVIIKPSDFFIDPNDIVRDINGAPHPASSLKLTSEFVNRHSCDHMKLCCTRETVPIVAQGASTKIDDKVTFQRPTHTDVCFQDNGQFIGHANGLTFHPLLITQPAHMQLQVGL